MVHVVRVYDRCGEDLKEIVENSKKMTRKNKKKFKINIVPKLFRNSSFYIVYIYFFFFGNNYLL